MSELPNGVSTATRAKVLQRNAVWQGFRTYDLLLGGELLRKESDGYLESTLKPAEEIVLDTYKQYCHFVLFHGIKCYKMIKGTPCILNNYHQIMGIGTYSLSCTLGDIFKRF